MAGDNSRALPSGGALVARVVPFRQRVSSSPFVISAITPTIAVMLVIFGAPLTLSLYLSFQGWNPTQPLFGGHAVGLANYIDLLTDWNFIRSILLTLGYTATVVGVELAAGFAIALLLNMDVPLIHLLRSLLIVPMMMTPIVAALCWKLLLDPNRGIVNYLLGSNVVWLGNADTALISVALVNIWQNAPYVAILLLAGLRSLSREPFEAAKIDGANRWQMLRYVVVPMLRPYILVALLLRTIFEFRSFDNVYVLTNGGPADATMLLSVFTYMTSFYRFDLSLGAAASWIMLGISLVMCAFFIVVAGRRKTK